MNTPENASRPWNPLDDFKTALPLADLRILLVEDVPDQQRIYLTMLRHAGAEIGLECNGRAAVKAALQASPAYDVVIMDMVMPLLDGVAATRELRQRGYTGPILAFTANQDEETRRVWFQAGCNAYLFKPLTPTRLIDTVVQLKTWQQKDTSSPLANLVG